MLFGFLIQMESGRRDLSDQNLMEILKSSMEPDVVQFIKIKMNYLIQMFIDIEHLFTDFYPSKVQIDLRFLKKG